MTVAPPLAPEPAPLKLIARIRAVISQQIQRSGSAQDRQRFADLLDAQELPPGRHDGRAEYPSKVAVLYATVLLAFQRIRDKAPLKEISGIVEKAEKIIESGSTGYALVGDPGTGWSIDFT